MFSNGSIPEVPFPVGGIAAGCIGKNNPDRFATRNNIRRKTRHQLGLHPDGKKTHQNTKEYFNNSQFSRLIE
jgi:hypothetical protein